MNILFAFLAVVVLAVFAIIGVGVLDWYSLFGIIILANRQAGRGDISISIRLIDHYFFISRNNRFGEHRQN